MNFNLSNIPTFGRQDEAAWLAQRIERPGLTLVYGHPGIGKTRLLEDLQTESANDTVMFGYHRCIATSNDILLRSLGSLYERWLSRAGFSEKRQVLDKLEERQKSLLGVLGTAGRAVANILKSSILLRFLLQL